MNDLTPGHRRHEDWLRAKTWDLSLPDGTPVEDLDGLARVLGTGRTAAAASVLVEPFGLAAPARLLAQARDELGQGRTGRSPHG